MEKNIFWLENDQLKEIASSFREKVEEGLKHENAEIQCIPTFISPKTSDINGKALVLDLGGTNYRVATVDLGQGSPTIHPNNGWKKDMSIMKSPGYTREELFKELADMIVGIKRDEEMPIGYCFSYPALNPQLHSRSATYIKRNGLLIRKITIKSSRPFQCAYHPLTP